MSEQKESNSHTGNNGCLPCFKSFATDSIHAGQPPDPISGAVITPISLSSTFAQESPGKPRNGYEYSRTNNPTRNAYEQCVAAIEGGKFGLAFASGSASTATILAMLNPGDHVITIDDVYGGTNRYFRKISSVASGISYSFVDMTKEGDLEAAFTDKTKLVWVESPTNPMLKIVDIAAVAKTTHAHNCILVVDNTFMSPFFQRPLSLGADIVVHSVSKYINGHTDVIGGVMALNDEKLNQKLRFLQNGMGAIPSPFDCFLAMRGLKTLAIRMKEHERNAIAIANFLNKHPRVEKTIYPGLASHPGHEIAKRQQTGFGGMITILLKGGLDQSRQFLEALKLFSVAESLGGVDSLAQHPAIMTHASIAPEERAKLGIFDILCRLSVGLEDTEDLIQDLSNALDAIKL